MKRFFLEDEINEIKWKISMEFAFKKANFCEFNQLYDCEELNMFLKLNEEDFIQKYDKKVKLFQNGTVFRFKLSDKMKLYFKEKDFKYFNTNFITDPSFYVDNNEIIATISHEDQIYLNSEFFEYNYFRSKGFELNHEVLI